MMPKLAIIRGYLGEPLRCAVIGWGNGVVLVASERAAAADLQGFPPPVGIPVEDSFEYEDSRFQRLRAKWQAGAQTEGKEWGARLAV